MRQIRLVTFDALHTLITPRYPIPVQYSQIFAPYIGELPPDRIKQTFKVALRAAQKDHPSYHNGAENWWRDVIRRTAIGAGANEQVLDTHLNEIVRKLMRRFSSKEGYKTFADAIPTVRRIQDELGIRTAVVSNGDSRIRAVLKDLEFPKSMEPIILSEEQGIEKPSVQIFSKTLEFINQGKDIDQGAILPEECLHVGDELVCDYNGAIGAGWHALLLRRHGPEGEHEHKEDKENLSQVEVVHSLDEIIEWLKTEQL